MTKKSSFSSPSCRSRRSLHSLYQIHAHQSALASTDPAIARHAALALRLNYGLALEAFFGMLGAVLQAPDCVFGWLNNYKNHELADLVRRIASGAPLRTLPPFRPVSWKHISSVLIGPLLATDPEQHAEVADLFATAWAAFAVDFISGQESREYNSLKHSFRVEPSAVAIELKHEATVLLRTESRLAHSFPYLKRISDKESHYNVSRATSFLEPTVCSAALAVLALSINNAVALRNRRACTHVDVAPLERFHPREL